MLSIDSATLNTCITPLPSACQVRRNEQCLHQHARRHEDIIPWMKLCRAVTRLGIALLGWLGLASGRFRYLPLARVHLILVDG
jgi:hypothetical protein